MPATLGNLPSWLDNLAGIAHPETVPTKRDVRLANRLRVARAERDLSQDELARAAGVSRQTISSIETGQYVPSALLAFRLASVLSVGVDQLFWLEGEMDGPAAASR
jgi:putative transcriptional regulator